MVNVFELGEVNLAKQKQKILLIIQVAKQGFIDLNEKVPPSSLTFGKGQYVCCDYFLKSAGERLEVN